MALISCPDCSKEVSDKAPACPNCGCPISASVNSSQDTNKSIGIPEEILKRLPFETKGLMSKITFDGKFVTITRGLLNPLGKGQTRIPITSISSIEWRAPGLQSGFLRFNVAQGLSRKPKLDRAKDAVRDDHAVMSTSSHSQGLLELKEMIEAVLNDG